MSLDRHGPAEEIGLSEKLERVRQFAGAAASDQLSRNLLHAYASTLTFPETCEAAILTIGDPTPVRLAIRNRLLKAKVADADARLAGLSSLADRLLALQSERRDLRTPVDALLAQLYADLPIPARHAVLELWMARGSKSGSARWLKALGGDAALFDAEAVYRYWQTTHDARAAKLIAYQADTAMLDRVLPDLIGNCEEGWIIGRAMLRATNVDDDTWASVRASHPATYAYLCARTDRMMTEEDALAIVHEAPSGFPDERGLAIWAIGQLGMWRVLENISSAMDVFRQKEWDQIA